MNLNIQTQKGAGYWGYMSIVVCLILIGKLGLATIPPYIDNRMLEKTIQEKLASAGKKTGDVVMKDIQKQMGVDSTSAGNVEDYVEVVSNTPGKVKLKTNYEVTENLVAHIKVVSKFEKEFSQ